MAHVLKDTILPCNGKSCNDCNECIHDVDLFNNNDNMKETCNNCESLIRNYKGSDRVQFNACCSRCIISYANGNRPRTIEFNTGPMLDIKRPEWCPKAKGFTKIYEGYNAQETPSKSTQMCLPPPPPKTEKKVLTYSEKRELLLKLPKRLEWSEIEEGGVYVIPKILSQSRKVVRVVVKTDTLIRCSEIDEFGKESQVCSSIYPNDIESVFITKLLKY